MDCNSAFCSPDNHNKDRDCFLSHVENFKRDLRFEARAELKFEFDKSGALLVAGANLAGTGQTTDFPSCIVLN
jgi:hypothetical protein